MIPVAVTVILTAMFDSGVANGPVRSKRIVTDRALRMLVQAVSLLLTLTMAGCQPEPGPPANVEPVALGFSGSETCSGCHSAEYASWQTSHHALAMQEVNEQTVLGDFSGTSFEYFGNSSEFFMRDGGYFVRTLNAAGAEQEFPIRYTFGVEPLQQYLIEFPRGHIQPLTIAWDSRSEAEGGNRWFHLYPDEEIAPDDELHWTGRTQNWNYMCAECHSTDLQKNYSLDTDSFATTWSEINVGCEGCHGPASRHVQQAQSEDLSGTFGLVVDLDDAGRASWVMNPATGIAERSEFRMRPPAQPEACGRCHARRSLLVDEYEHGKPLMDTHSPALLDEGLYYPDGQILDEVYVYASFLQSSMYRAGVSCSDCHDPHSARLKSGGEPSTICSTCHLPEKFASGTHHNHQPDQVACVDCHMPERTYMGVDPRRDHSIRVPRPDLTDTTGVPNACSNCHGDRANDWLLAAVREWYGDEHEPHYATAIHAAQSDEVGANGKLIAAVKDESFPGIARGTALTHLRPPYSGEEAETIRDALQSPDPFIRIGALRALPSLQPELRAQWGGPLLIDELRAVRVEAVHAVQSVRASLHVRFEDAFRNAERELFESLHVIAERPEAHLNLGNYFARSGDGAGAETEYRTALRLEPDSVAARVNLADLYRLLGRETDAEETIRDGLALHGDDPSLRHSLGLLLVRSGRQAEALEQLEAAATGDIDNPRFAYVYGVALNSTGREDAAITFLTDAVERFPADFDISWALTTILRDSGKRAEAQEIGGRLAERYPENDAVRQLVQSL